MAKVETIVKKHTIKNKETGEKQLIETEYRVDAGFIPQAVGDICPEFIEAYCVANNQTDWLVEQVEKNIVDKNGKEKSLPFVSLRAEFVKKFFPKAIAASKPAETFKDRILAKYKK